MAISECTSNRIVTGGARTVIVQGNCQTNTDGRVRIAVDVINGAIPLFLSAAKRHSDPNEDSVSAKDGLRPEVSGVADFFLRSLVATCYWSELHLSVIRTEHFMHKVLRVLLVAFLGLALLAGTAGVASAAVPSTYTQQVIDLTNQERAKVGCAPLARHAGLVDFAQKWANTMASQKRLYHSSGPTSFGFRTWGENIAYGQSTPQAVVTAWMNSAGHRANILNCRFTQIGVGAQTDSGGRMYWAQDFGG